MYSNATLNFCHKVNTFTTVQNMSDKVEEFLSSHMKKGVILSFVNFA